MSTEGRMRASIQLRENASANAAITESLGPATPVEIIEDQGDWVKVKASRLTHAIPGWVLREALAFPREEMEVFPQITLATGETFPSAPSSLKAVDLSNWLESAGGKPDWIPQNTWNQLSGAERQTVTDDIRSAVQQRQNEWDAWTANIAASGRREEALLEEWLVVLRGGMDVWTVRTEMLYSEAAEKKGHQGWVIESDIMRWTGRIKRNDQELKYKIWYEATLYKTNKLLKGWFKGDLVDPYIYPTRENDTAIPSNLENQFDLGRPLLRHPADPEIDAAVAANRTGYQYIDIINALGRSKIHHNLCGEFCVAALAGVDVIPLLNQWKAAYPKALDIMKNDTGTGLTDVLSMLKLFDLKSEEYRHSPSITAISPMRLLKRIQEGKMAFSGVGIYKSNGKLCGKEPNNSKTTRHWVVLEDVIPVGNNGWVRIYNPFRNREEVYTYDLFIESVGQFPIGLWVNLQQ